VPPHAREVLVDDRAAGRRVDVWLAGRFPSWSRSAIAREISAGRIDSAQRRLKPASLLRQGEVLRIISAALAPEGPPPPIPPLIHQDRRLLVYNKPPNLLCHPVGERFEYGLIGLARLAHPDEDLDLAHRLDRETSGVVVLTRDRAANAFVKAAFKGRTARKTYLAIVRGNPTWQEIEVDAPIGRAVSSEIRLRRGVNPDGPASQTRFEVVQQLVGHCLIACHPRTGRTHQLRVHLEHVGFPILGDKVYGQPDAPFLHHLDHGDDAVVRAAIGFPRQALHAHQLWIPHPDGGEVALEAPLAPDLQAVVDGAAPAWDAPVGGDGVHPGPGPGQNDDDSEDD
jgi:23S rRNA pseudouridine1911/1915/1917 synthase